MGSDDLFWKRKRGKIERKRHNRGLPKPRILIACEGKCTESNYFKSFRMSTAVIKIEGLGCNTLSLVKKAAKLKNDSTYDLAWVVFDRDEHGLQNFNAALSWLKSTPLKSLIQTKPSNCGICYIFIILIQQFPDKITL